MSWKNKFPKENRFFETENGILYYEDSLKILEKFPQENIDLLVTDPPYAISQKGKKISRKSLSSKSWKRNMDIRLDFGEWDWFETEKDFFEFTKEWFGKCVSLLKEKTWIYIFFDKQKLGYFDLFLAPYYNIRQRCVFVYCKVNPAPSFRKVNWLSATEFVWVGSKGKCKLKNFLQQKEMFNYMILPNKSSYGKTSHPTEKPEKLIERFIETSSYENEIVLDPFLGSGTTAVVAEKLNRKWIGTEINKEYCEIAKKRILEETSQLQLGL